MVLLGVFWIPMEPVSIKQEADDYMAEAYNNYLNSQVIAPWAGELSKGQVLKYTLE